MARTSTRARDNAITTTAPPARRSLRSHSASSVPLTRGNTNVKQEAVKKKPARAISTKTIEKKKSSISKSRPAPKTTTKRKSRETPQSVEPPSSLSSSNDDDDDDNNSNIENHDEDEEMNGGVHEDDSNDENDDDVEHSELDEDNEEEEDKKEKQSASKSRRGSKRTRSIKSTKHTKSKQGSKSKKIKVEQKSSAKNGRSNSSKKNNRKDSGDSEDDSANEENSDDSEDDNDQDDDGDRSAAMDEDDDADSSEMDSDDGSSKSKTKGNKQKLKSGKKSKAKKPVKLHKRFEKIIIRPLTSMSENISDNFWKLKSPLDRPETHLISECCSRCASREVFRALLQKKTSLLTHIVNDVEHVSDPFIQCSIDRAEDALHQAIRSKNLPAVQVLLHQLTIKRAMGSAYYASSNNSHKDDDDVDASKSINSKAKFSFSKPKPRIPYPSSTLNTVSTGSNSIYFLGHATKSINMSRGNREGNNALSADTFSTSNSLEEYLEYAYRYGSVEIIELFANSIVPADDFFINPSNSNTYRKTLIARLRYEEPLQQSLHAGNLSVFRYLLKLYMDEFTDADSVLGMTKLLYLVTAENEPLPVFRAASSTKKSTTGMTPVHAAAINSNAQYLQTLVQVGGLSILNIPDSSGRKAIHFAAASETSAALEYVLSIGVNPMEPFGNRFNPQTPLHIAIEYNRPQNVKILISSLKKRSSTSTSSKKKKTNVLFIKETEVLEEVAATGGRRKSAKKKPQNDLILLNDPKHLISAPDRREKQSHLHRAAINGHADICGILIYEGCDPFLPDKEKHTPLHLICQNTGSLQCVKAVIDAAIKVYETDESYAAISSTSDIHLVIKSKLLMARDRMGRLPMHCAIKNGFWDVVQYMVSQGVPATSADSSDNTCLHYACGYGYAELAELLIAAGASCTSLNMWKLSPLMIALLKNHIKCAEVILRDKTVNVDDVDSEGKTCLIHALTGRAANPDLTLQKVRYLVEGRNAKVNIADAISGRTALHHYCNSISTPNDSILFELLFKHGAAENINSKDLEGKTPICLAIQANNVYCVQALLNAGASCDVITLKDGSQTTPLIMALRLERAEDHHITASQIELRKEFSHSRRMILQLICQKSIASSSQSMNTSNEAPAQVHWCNIKTNQGLSALHYAAQSSTSLEDCIVVLSIPQIDINIASGDSYGATALATFITNTPNPGYSYEKVTNQNQTSSSFRRYSSLSNIHIKRYIAVIQLFLNHGADPNIPWRNSPVNQKDNQKEKPFKLEEYPLLIRALQTHVQLRLPLFTLLVNFGIQINQLSSTKDNILHVLFRLVGEMPIDSFLTLLSEKSASIMHELAKQYNDAGLSPTLQLIKSCTSLSLIASKNGFKTKFEKSNEKVPELIHCDFDESLPFPVDISVSCETDFNVPYLFTLDVLEPLLNLYKKTANPNLSDPVNESLDAKEKAMANNNNNNNTSRESRTASSNRPLCKYGAQCYRTHNIMHTNEYHHPHLINTNTTIANGNNGPRFQSNGQLEVPSQADLHYTGLHLALEHRNEFVIPWLITNGSNLLAKDWKGRTPLIFAANIGYHNVATLLLQHDNGRQQQEQLAAFDHFGCTSLHHAISYSSTHNNDQARGFDEAFIMESILLRAGSDPNVKDKEQRTPLHYLFIAIGQASVYEGSDPIELLSDFCSATVKQKLLCDEKDVYGRTPLIYCAMRGAQICSTRLLSLGAKRDVYDNDGNGLLQHSLLGRHLGFCMTLMNFSDIDVMRPIIRFQEINKKTEKTLITPFQYAINLKDARWSGFLYLMIDSGLIVDIALQDALGTHSFSLILKILNKSDPRRLNDINNHGKNLLHIIANYEASNDESWTAFNTTWGHKICRVLLDLQVNLTTACAAADNHFRSPLHYAALNGHVDFAHFLLGIYPKAAELLDYQSRTPLHLALSGLASFPSAKRARIQLIQLLMPYSKEESISRYISFDNILKAHDKRARAQTKQRKFELISPPSDKATLPLIVLAIQKKYEAEAYLLLQFGISPNVTDGNKRTSLMLCVRENYQRMVLLLLQSPDVEKTINLDLYFNDSDTIFSNRVQTLAQYQRQRLDLNLKDVNGATFLHHIVYPLGYYNYSYENANMFKMIIERATSLSLTIRFDIKDNDGHSAIWYAAQQDSQTLLNAFLTAGATLSDTEKQSAIAAKITYMSQHSETSVDHSELPLVDVDKDAEQFKNFFEHGGNAEGDIEEEILNSAEVDPTDLRTTCVVHKDDSSLYDIMLTFTDVGSGRFGKHTFYKMQLLHNSAQDLWILFTRWGRVGDTGEMQRTPISTKDNAIKEFCKIFKSKTGNDWENRSRELFTVKPGKYVIKRVKASKNKNNNNNGGNNDDESEELVIAFDKLLGKHRTLLPKSHVSYWVYDTIFNMLDIGALQAVSNNLAHSDNALKDIETAQLQEASEVLKSIEHVLAQYQNMEREVKALQSQRNLVSITSLMSNGTREDDHIDNDKLLDSQNPEIATLDERLASVSKEEKAYHAELVSLSNKFFSLVPFPHFTNSRITEINTVKQLCDIKYRMNVVMNLSVSLHILTGIRWHLHRIELGQTNTHQQTSANASSNTKSFVGQKIANIEEKIAQNRMEIDDEKSNQNGEIFVPLNPIDYTLAAIKTKLSLLDSNSVTFNFIKTYMRSNNSSNYDLLRVFEVYNEDHLQRYQPYSNSGNRRLLWHGSGVGNFCGILKDGLRIAPPEASHTGAMFGNGIYFADQFQKSLNYCSNPYSNFYGYGQQRRRNNDEIWLFLCEVALGSMYEAYQPNSTLLTAPEGYDSTFGVGTHLPDPNQCLISPSGVLLPIGPIIRREDNTKPAAVDKNEFIVYQVERVRIRYIVQVKPHSNKMTVVEEEKLKQEMDFFTRMGRMRLENESFDGTVVESKEDDTNEDDEDDEDDDDEEDDDESMEDDEDMVEEDD